jgi:hypothetical protein
VSLGAAEASQFISVIGNKTLTLFTMTGVAGDFEIVPRPSEVLVLPMDEGFEDENDDLYAGWEDISLGALRGTSVGHESRTGVATGGAQLKFPPVSYAAALSAHQ